jgi:hypothetical protein
MAIGKDGRLHEIAIFKSLWLQRVASCCDCCAFTNANFDVIKNLGKMTLEISAPIWISLAIGSPTRMASVRAIMAAMKSSAMLRWTNTRVAFEQTSPPV